MSQKGQEKRRPRHTAATEKIRRHYWNPREANVRFVDAEHFLYAFNLRQEAGTWSDRHAHAGYGEIFYYSTGNSVLCTERGNLACNLLRAVWIPPGVEHEWYLPEASLDRTLFVHASAVEGREHFNSLHMVEVNPLLRELIFVMADTPPDLTSPQGLRLGQVLLDRFEAAPPVPSPLAMPHNHRLVELCAGAVSAPDRPISLEEWSRSLHVAGKTLARMFLRETGLTMGRWVRQMRLQHALQRIECGWNVTAAALDSGYDSVSAFIHAFKKVFGYTPGRLCRTDAGEAGQKPPQRGAAQPR